MSNHAVKTPEEINIAILSSDRSLGLPLRKTALHSSHLTTNLRRLPDIDATAHLGPAARKLYLSCTGTNSSH